MAPCRLRWDGRPAWRTADTEPPADRPEAYETLVKAKKSAKPQRVEALDEAFACACPKCKGTVERPWQPVFDHGVPSTKERLARCGHCCKVAAIGSFHYLGCSAILRRCRCPAAVAARPAQGQCSLDSFFRAHGHPASLQRQEQPQQPVPGTPTGRRANSGAASPAPAPQQPEEHGPAHDAEEEAPAPAPPLPDPTCTQCGGPVPEDDCCDQCTHALCGVCEIRVPAAGTTLRLCLQCWGRLPGLPP